MKSLFSLVVAFVLLMSLSACSETDSNTKETSKETVPATQTPLSESAPTEATENPTEPPETTENTIPSQSTEDPCALLYGDWYRITYNWSYTTYNEDCSIMTEVFYRFDENGTCSRGGTDWQERTDGGDDLDLKAYDKYWYVVGGSGESYTYTYDGTTLTLFIQYASHPLDPDQIGKPSYKNVTVKGDEMYVYYNDRCDVYYRGEMDWDSTNTTP